MKRKFILITVIIIAILSGLFFYQISSNSKTNSSHTNSSTSGTSNLTPYVYPITEKTFPSLTDKYHLNIYPPEQYLPQPPQHCPFSITDNQGNTINIPNMPFEFINCNGNPYAGVITDFKGWINDTHLLIENQPGTIMIIDLQAGDHDAFDYDSNKYWFSAVDQTPDIWLMEKRTQNFTYDLINSQNQIIKSNIEFNITDDNQYVVDTLYDWVNQGFLFIIKRDSQPEPNTQFPTKTTTEFHFLPISTMETELIYKTPEMDLFGTGCTHSQIQPQIGSILITPGCYQLPIEKYNDQGKFLLEL